MIDKEIFAQQMGLLGDRIGRTLAGPTLREYYRELSAALTTEQFVAATTLVFRAWSGEFRNWPSPQQMVELIAPVAQPAVGALEAFELVLAITNDPRIPGGEQRAKVQALGPTALRSFYACGGFRDFSNILEADVTWLRKRFVAVYESVSETADAERVATLALDDAESRVAGLIGKLAEQRSLPAGQKVSA